MASYAKVERPKNQVIDMSQVIDAGCRVTSGLRSLLAITILATMVLPVSSIADCVVVMHGLARSASAMKPVVKPLQKAGYNVVNVDYPSTSKPVAQLAPLAVAGLGISQCPDNDTVHFVTHSMGGILVRYFLQDNVVPNLGKVVMIAPPNQGSEVVDRLRHVPGYNLINGPAGQQLGTDDNSVPGQLGPVDFTLGVIAGTKSINPLFSIFLPSPNDGTVAMESTKVAGMDDFIALHRTHTFIMRADDVIHQVLYFLKHSRFDHNVSGNSRSD